jgi:ATP-binding cassette, subfamily C (CFTR/MRP), member 1
VISTSLLIIQCALLVVRCKNSVSVRSASTTAGAFEVVCVSALIILIFLEHRRSIKPSTTVSLYLLLSGLSSAIEIRALLLQHSILIPQLLGAAICCKGILLWLESWPKKLPNKSEAEHSPEELAGVLSRAVFWWLNPLLRLGSRKVLKPTDLYPLNHEFRGTVLQPQIQDIWAYCELLND